MELQLYPSFSLCTTLRWVVNTTHSSYVPGKESQYPFQGCWVDHGWSEQLWKMSPALRFILWTIQPVASRCTDCAILATFLKVIPLNQNCFLSHYCMECVTGLNIFFFNIGKLHISELVIRYICFRFLSLLLSWGPAESFLYLCFASLLSCFAVWDLSFCRCLTDDSGVWQWVRGLVVSDVSKERCSLICSGQGVVSPLLLQAGSGIRSHPSKPAVISLLSVIQHSTLMFVNLHSL